MNLILTYLKLFLPSIKQELDYIEAYEESGESEEVYQKFFLNKVEEFLEDILEKDIRMNYSMLNNIPRRIVAVGTVWWYLSISQLSISLGEYSEKTGISKHSIIEVKDEINYWVRLPPLGYHQ